MLVPWMAISAATKQRDGYGYSVYRLPCRSWSKISVLMAGLEFQEASIK